MLHPLRPIADGNVTAATDARGRVTASSYDEFGQAVAGYQGQVVSSVGGDPGYSACTPSWTFGNLTPSSVTPASALTCDVYLQSSTTAGYTVADAGGNTLPFAAQNDPTAPSLGDIQFGRQHTQLPFGNFLWSWFLTP